MSRKYECLEVEQVGDVCVAHFKPGNLEEAWVHQLGDELLALIQEDGARKLLVSFNNMECLYSLLLGKLIRAKRVLDGLKGKMKLCDVPPLAREVFQVCKLDSQFDFTEDKATALRTWQATA